MAAFNAMTNGAELGDCMTTSLSCRRDASWRRQADERMMQKHPVDRARRLRLRCRRVPAPDRRTSAARARRRRVDSQAGEPVAKTFPHLAPRYPRAGSRSSKRSRELATALPQAAAVGCAARRRRAADRRAADGGRSAGVEPRVVDISADFRFANAGAYEAVYRHAHGAPERLTEFTCAVPEHLDAHRHAACGASRLLRDRDAARHRAAAAARARRAAFYAARHHGQHRRRAHAGCRHAPSAAAERPVRVQAAEAPARAGDHALCAGSRAATAISTSCRIPARSHAAFTHRSCSAKERRSRRRS